MRWMFASEIWKNDRYRYNCFWNDPLPPFRTKSPNFSFFFEGIPKVIFIQTACADRHLKWHLSEIWLTCEILNSKSELHQPPIVEVRSEISQSLWQNLLVLKPFLIFHFCFLILYSVFQFIIWLGAKLETCHKKIFV